MKMSYKVTLLAVPLAIISFIFSRIIWPDPAGMMGPSASLIPGFIFISALESVAFGVGVAFLVFGWSRFRQAFGHEKLAIWAFLAICWMLVSWWPHDNMHRVNPMNDYAGLLRIEFIFHFSLIIAAFIVAAFLWRMATRSHSR